MSGSFKPWQSQGSWSVQSVAKPAVPRTLEEGVLTPSFRTVDFKKWHADRKHLARPQLGKTPAHLKARKQEVITKCTTEHLRSAVQGKKKSATRSLGSSMVGFNSMNSSVMSFASDYSAGYSEADLWGGFSMGHKTMPADMWSESTHHRRGCSKPKEEPVYDEKLHKDWSQGVWKQLPSVGRHRTNASPLKKLMAAASVPDINYGDMGRQILLNGSPKASGQNSRVQSRQGNRTSSKERPRKGSAHQLDPSSSSSGKRDDLVAAREELVSRGSAYSGAGLHGTDAEMVKSASKQKVGVMPAGLSLSTNPDKHLVNSEAADLAHKWHLPLSSVTEAKHIFERFAKVPSWHTDEEKADIMRYGMMGSNEMMSCAMELANIACAGDGDMIVTPKEIMGIIDKNLDGQVSFHEFVEWYHERQFLEYVNLSKEEITLRKMAVRMGLTVKEMDDYKNQFERFDIDNSGHICLKEFTELMHLLLKVPAGMRIPQSRIAHFWQEADHDNNKFIDLEEFVYFYSNHFAPGCETPMEDFYESFRPCCIRPHIA